MTIRAMELLIVGFTLVLFYINFATCGENHVIPGKYMILLKANTPSSSLGDLRNKIEILVEEPMGDFTFLHVNLKDEDVEDVKVNSIVEVVEQVRMHSLDPESEGTTDFIAPASSEDSLLEKIDWLPVCKFQAPIGKYNYGIIRTSYNERPDYFADFYQFKHYGKGVDIYILDSGIDTKHVEFQSRASNGFVVEHLKESEGFTDFIGHGTFVAGMAGGLLFGTAKWANLISVKVVDRNKDLRNFDVLSGVLYVTKRVQKEKRQGLKVRAIINLSLRLGYYESCVHQAIKDAIKEGIIVIASAGNKKNNASSQTPGGFKEVITVGATDIDDKFYEKSNWGESVDVSAPGVDVYAAQSGDSRDCKWNSIVSLCIERKSGTSFSTPIVSGLVARYLADIPDDEIDAVNQEVVKAMLIETSTKDMIQFNDRDQKTTPNRLVFMDCSGSMLKLSVNLAVSTALHIWLVLYYNRL